MGLFSNFFNKDDTENYSIYKSNPESGSDYSSSHSSSNDYYSSSHSSSNDYDDDDDDCDFEINFFNQLSNGALIFKIVDEDNDFAGHIIVSANKKITIIESDFYEFEKDDKNHLKSQVQKFCDAL